MAKILFVDDNPEDVSNYRALVGDQADVTIAHPDEVDDAFLEDVDLVLIDYKLDYWPAREDIKQVGFRPLTGVALAAVFRDYLNLRDRVSSPTAFGILTGHIGELARGLPVEHRRQVLSATNNLEWIFPKATPEVVARQAVSLALAVSELPSTWPTNNHAALEQQVVSLLKLEETDWKQRVLEDVERCHPPLHELSEWSHGLAMVRWMLHLILPYPCFLLDSVELAARLRVSHKSLVGTLSSSACRALFSPAEYRGILSTFDGFRWWRSGVESLLWELTGGKSFDIPTLHSRLKATVDGLEAFVAQDPVVCLDQNYDRLESLVPATAAVRIQPDYWPAFAEPAWTTIALARQNQNLRALVIEQDRAALVADPPAGAS